MRKFDQQALIEAGLYILDKTGGLDFYHVFKVLYFAHRIKLAEWGLKLTEDDFSAFDYGPVPVCLYDAVKGKENSKSPGLLAIYRKAVKKAGEDAPNVLLALRKPDMDYLSAADVEALDKAIKGYARKTFQSLKNLSHDSAWKAAYGREGSKLLDVVDIARAADADEALIDYIREKESLNVFLA